MKLKFSKYLSPAKKNFTVGIIFMVTRTIITLFLVPFYINILGNDIYSDWIILYSLPAIFELTNLGINKGVNNTFTFLANNNKVNESKDLISLGITFTLSVCLIISLSIYLFWNYLGIRELIGINSISQLDTLIIIILMTLKLFIDMIRGILCSFFISKNEAYKSYLIFTIQYLLEVFAIVIILINLKNILYVALALTTISILVSVILYIYTYFLYEYRLKITIKYFRNFGFLRSSLGFSFITISQFIREQGVLIIIKNLFSADILIVYNTTKILTNYLNILSGQISNAVSPVFNYYYSKKLKSDIRSLYRKTNILNISTSITLGFILIIFGKSIWQIWLNNSIQFDYNLLILLVICAVLKTLWTASKTVLIGSNNHFNFSIFSLTMSLISLLILILMLKSIVINIYLAPAVLILFNILIILFFIKNKILLKV